MKKLLIMLIIILVAQETKARTFNEKRYLKHSPKYEQIIKQASINTILNPP